MQPSIQVFLSKHLQSDNSTYVQFEQAIENANIFITGLIFDPLTSHRVANILERRQHQLLACLGTFEFDPFSNRDNVYRLLSDDPSSIDNESKQMNDLELVRNTSKISGIFITREREDVSTYIRSFHHWMSGNVKDVKTCLESIIERSIVNGMEKDEQKVVSQDTHRIDCEQHVMKMEIKKELMECSQTVLSKDCHSMPTPWQLEQTGHQDLTKKIGVYLNQTKQSIDVIAEDIGLESSTSCQLAWKKYVETLVKFHLRYPQDLARELAQLNRRTHKSENCMPSVTDIFRERRKDLHEAVLRLGGYRQAAKVLGLRRYRRSPKTMKRLEDFNVFTKKLKTFLKQRAQEMDSARAEWIEQIMPRMVDFREAGRTDLLEAIHYHGGQHAVAQKLGLQMHYQAACNQFLTDFKCLKQEIKRVLVEELGDVYPSNEMPTMNDFKNIGRMDLIAAIRIHGGMRKVANRIQLKLRKGSRATQLRIKDWNWLKKEIEEWIRTHGNPSFPLLPTSRQLLEAGRQDMVRAIRFHGGQEQVANKLGLMKGDKTIFDENFLQSELYVSSTTTSSTHRSSLNKEGRREAYYWCHLENVRKELLAFVFEHGQPGVMPTRAELLKAGRGDLLRGMAIHGGQKAVARDLSLIMMSQAKRKTRK
eukprot:jgi/Galph1/3182/GphlegSOOS_G1833.1